MSSPNDYMRIPAMADVPPTAIRAGRVWTAILTIAVIGATFALSCVTPFAALAVAVAGTLGLRASLRVVAVVWFANQVIGFVFFHFPLTANAFLWGFAIGIAAVVTTVVASIAMKYLASAPVWLRLAVCLLSSFAIYEMTLLGAAVVLGGFETFAPSIVGQLLWITAASLVAMVILNELVAALLKPWVGSIPRLAKAI